MGKVRIINLAGHDFSQAEKWGELVAVTTGNLNIFRPERDLYNITEQLKDFDEEEDYLLLSGNVLANWMVAAVLFCVNKVTTLNLLIYDAKNHCYLEHTIYLDKNSLKFLRDDDQQPQLNI